MTTQLINEKWMNQKVERYFVQAKTFELEGISYTGYGIRVHMTDGYFDIDDLSTNEIAVKELVNDFNEGKLSLIHLEDAIEDFLIG